MVKKSTSSNAFSDTYYDSALQLTAMQGVDDVYFSVQKPYIFFKLTRLESILRTCRNSLIQINALILLARFDSSKISEAVEVCHRYKYLPGEVELFTYYLHNKKLPINCAFHDQFEIADKIWYLLSLKRNAQYKGILGLHEGKDDELYLRQKDYPAELKCTFESNCYLLPHESQDIWLQKPHHLSQRTGSRDIDGML